MYIKHKTKKYPCGGRPVANADTVRFTGVEDLLENVSGTIGLFSDDGFELAAYDTGDWLRVVVDNTTLTLTNLPEPEPVEGPPEQPTPGLTLEERVGSLETNMETLLTGLEAVFGE